MISSEEISIAKLKTINEVQTLNEPQQPHKSHMIADIPLERVNKKQPIYEAVKRIFDILFSIICIVLTSPIMLVVAIVIKAEDGGPAIYTQIRQGKNGKSFKLYKYRSMVVDADDLKRWLTPEQHERYMAEIKLDNDPRITRVGNFVRRTSLDELPQLLNVLKGDMSIVGPRPVVSSELQNYSRNELELLFFAKPGMTGYWQVNGRNNSTYESGERQRMELYYAENRSIILDIKILFQTIPAVLKSKGAK